MSQPTPRLAIHGGCGNIRREDLGAGRENAVREALRDVTASVLADLRAGSPALDAAERAVALLEDCEYFNAGLGSVLNAQGRVETDAAVMEGATARAGAVASLQGIRNPVKAARRVLEDGEHVLLAGEGARRFAERAGLEAADDEELIIPVRWEQLEAARTAGRVSLDHDERYGTVGAVVRDARGCLAAASSTGGMTNKHPGRVGDTPVIGSGLWADDATCAVAGTGHGEYYLRTAFAHDVHARMAYLGQALDQACAAALARVRELGGSGGVVAVDESGELVLRFTTTGMYRAWCGADAVPRAAIFAAEER